MPEHEQQPIANTKHAKPRALLLCEDVFQTLVNVLSNLPKTDPSNSPRSELETAKITLQRLHAHIDHHLRAK